ncbi:MAG TPA: flavodoxin family protein [Alphaproteobacteria bacterium]|nr:flavodoxin family protein [Alphaproteobacteria bacterium]
MSAQTPARIAVVFHSRSGHTAAIAEHVLKGISAIEGVEARLVNVDAEEPPWDYLHGCTAILFGCPTHFGSVSAEMKRFMDDTDAFWREMRWRDKLAAGFTCAGEPSGDKLTVLQQMIIFAGQHGMIWVGMDPMKDKAAAGRRPEGYNRQGGYIGAMADADGDALGPNSPPRQDRATAECLGRRMAELSKLWTCIAARTQK